MGQVVRRQEYSLASQNFRTGSNFITVCTFLNSEKYVNGEKQEESAFDHVLGLPLKYIVNFDGHLDSL